MLSTLRCTHTYLSHVQKSRFLAQASPAENVTQAMDFIGQVSNFLATHNCWAYRIGQEYRFSDDGEPGGTAGRPILLAIETQALDRVAVVVTRWYGGIKLGTGGLARAYGGSAAECLRLAERQAIVAMARLSLHCSFAELTLMSMRLQELGARIEEETFGVDGVTLTLSVPEHQLEAVQARVRDISHGRSKGRRID
ncbi:MAG: YigZ family protein [Dyella sp.]